MRNSLVGSTLFVMLSAVGCSVPPPDTTGKIRAGNAGENSCPPGFIVRWGRCCPAGSTATQCPLEIDRDTTGESYVPLSCSCASGTTARGGVCCADNSMACTGPARTYPMGCTCPVNYELRFGKCCPTDAGSECPYGEIGSPCEVNEDCRLPIGARNDLSPSCATRMNFTGQGIQPTQGYCMVAGCRVTEDCGPNGECIQVQILGVPSGQGFCARKCPAGPATALLVCPQTGGTFTCERYRGSVNGLAVTNMLNFCMLDCTLDPNVCQGDYGCDPVRHYCARRCALASDRGACMLAGYRDCDTTISRCVY